ncbi:MAG: sulfotransferase [Gammaproteobacteria bacterium]|nr:sulfotransferase [Gammaproteobacteria bacterium]
MQLPNFLVIGVAKAGTTSLYYYLKEHPHVHMSWLKEPRFFAYDETNPKHRAADAFPVRSMADYIALFNGVTTEKAVGEASPNYLHSRFAAHAIRTHIPDAKLIAILRNPIDKTISGYNMRVRVGNETHSWENILDGDEDILRSSLYYNHVKYYLDLFGKDRLKILLFDDLEKDAISVMRETYRYLEVDDTFRANVSTRHNTGTIKKARGIQYFRLQYRKSLGMTRAVQSIVPSGIRRRLANIGSSKFEKAEISTDERAGLINYYREDILKLQDLIHQDLGAWLDL